MDIREEWMGTLVSGADKVVAEGEMAHTPPLFSAFMKGEITQPIMERIAGERKLLRKHQIHRRRG